MDIAFVSPFVAGLIFGGIALVGVLTGKILTGPSRGFGPEFIIRRDSPGVFWLHVAIWAGGGASLLGLAFSHAARV